MSDSPKHGFKLPPEQQAIRDKCFHPSGTFVEFPIEDVETSIPARFEKIVRAYPNRLAVKDGEHALDYETLNAKANRIAHGIIDKFDIENHSIAVMLEHGIGAIAAVLGVFKAGKTLVVLDASSPRQRIAETLENSTAVGIVTNSTNEALATTLTPNQDRLLNVDVLDGHYSADNLGLSLSPDRIAQILYTSASTGRAKGVNWDCRFLLHHAMSAINAGRLCADDRLSLLFSPGSSVFPQNILRALLVGAGLFPLDLKLHSSESVADWLTAEKITVYRAFASTFRNLTDCLNLDRPFSDLRLVQVGGEQVSKQDFDNYKRVFPAHTIFMQLCGTTETGEIGCYFANHQTHITERTVPIGVTSQDKEVWLADESDGAVEAGEVGEIMVRSRYLAKGYWQDAQLTNEKFIPHPDGIRRIYRTGDLGRGLAKGGFVHLGRKDGLVKVRGYRVGLSEIEAVLQTHSQVKECAVLALDNAAGEKYLAAYVVARGGSPLGVGGLLEFLRASLPTHMLPSRFVFLDFIPQANGKIDRRSLPRPERTRGNLEQDYVAPSSETERQLTQIWQEVLDVTPVGVHDNFFELGGHSLAATRIVARVLKEFQQNIALRSLFESPTVHQMAQSITSHRGPQIGNKELERLLAEVETMTEAEAQKLLAEKSANEDNV